MAEVKQRLKQALRSDLSNDSDKPDQVTSLTFLIRALRADLGSPARVPEVASLPRLRLSCHISRWFGGKAHGEGAAWLTRNFVRLSGWESS